MIAFIALTALAIALLPVWAPTLGPGAAIGRFLHRTSTTLEDISYANRRLRELQLDLPQTPRTTRLAH
ncbi:hypothetical protein [Microlunatus soli]|nr:hypothetical protein [Microlunatus soli]